MRVKLGRLQKEMMLIIENKLLKRIYGPMLENGVYRIRTNIEMQKIYNEPDILVLI